MTEPAEPVEMTDAELETALFAAARALIKARLSRNAAQIAIAQAEYDRLIAIKASRE